MLGEYDYDVFDGLGDCEIHPEDAEWEAFYVEAALNWVNHWIANLMAVAA